jgi:hypothetical protein
MRGIFISYSRVDRPFAERLARHLRRTYSYEAVWFDEQLRGGQDWWDEIVMQIDLRDVFILLVSPESLDSKYCMLELGEARKRHKHVIPILVRARTTVPKDISQLHMIDMSGDINVENFTDLQAALNFAPPAPFEAPFDTPSAFPAATPEMHPAPPPEPTLPNRSHAAMTLPTIPRHDTRPAPSSYATLPSRAAAGILAAPSYPPAATFTVPRRAWVGVALLVAVAVAVLGVLAVSRIGRGRTTVVAAPQDDYTMASMNPTIRPANAQVGVPLSMEAVGGLVLVYNGGSLTLLNPTDTLYLDASNLVFTNTTDPSLAFESNRWAGGSALGLLGPRECVQVWTTDYSQLNPPPECVSRLRWWQASERHWFWLGDAGQTFTVTRNGALLATCDVGNGTCVLN